MLSVSLACIFVSAPLREDRVTFGSPFLLTVIMRNGKFFCLLGRTVLRVPSLPSVKKLSTHQFNIVVRLKSTQC